MRAASAVCDAAKAENHTGLNLDNPEVEFSYQWGQPSYVPDKKTIDVSQTFDFATLSGGKRRVADARDAVSESEMQISRRDLAAEVDALMTEVVYRRQLAAHYDSTMQIINRLYAAAEKSYEKGNISAIDINSIRMELNTLRTEAKINDIECATSMGRLQGLAGGKLPEWKEAEYMAYTLPADFDAWAAGSAQSAPGVENARTNAALAGREVSLRRSEGLPSFSLGYTSELVTDANYHGVAVGVTLPLWGNAGRVKAAKAAETAAQLEVENKILEYTLRQRELYEKARAYGEMETQNRAMRDECDIRSGLRRLFDAGQLSVHDYLSQLLPLFELDRKVLDARHDYQAALTEFRAASL